MQGRKWRLWSVRNKIIFIIYIVIFPVLIVTGAFMHVRNAQTVRTENAAQYQTTVDVLADSIGYFEQDLGDILIYVIVNSDVGRVLRAAPTLGREDPLFWQSLSPLNLVTDMLNVKGNIRTLILYPENGLAPYYSSQDGSVMVKDIAQIRKLDVYSRAVDALGDVVWGQAPAGPGGLYEKNQQDKIIMAREIFDGAKQTRLGFLALSVNVDQYAQMLESSLLYPHDGIVLFDDEYNEITRVGQVEESALAYVTRTRLAQTLLDEEGGVRAEEGSYLFCAERDTGGWVFYLSPKSAWDARIQEGLVQPILLGLALLVSIWPISLIASRIFSRPLLRLHTSMNRFKEGDFSQRVQATGSDEIADLSAAFNDMVSELKEMIDRNYVMVLREKESELNALQAQINPHFLYNALDSLYWQASDAEQEELAENILAMSELFRLVLSSGQSEITVRQEIALVTNYLHIQKMRYSKRLDYTVQVSEDIMAYPISKLILQPFVENAIVHGLERTGSWGFVRISGEKRDGTLHFLIEDNGGGIPKEALEEILFASEDTRYANQRVGHYAIRNVKERMAIRYGDLARLDIHSEVGVGTRVSIIIPLEKSGEA